MSSLAAAAIIEGTNIVDPRVQSVPVTVLERMGEITIREWCVKARDAVQPDTVVAIVEDRYGEITVEAGQSGVVAALMHPEGTRLAPHAVMCYIRVPTAPAPPLSVASPVAPRRLVEHLHAGVGGQTSVAEAQPALSPSHGQKDAALLSQRDNESLPGLMVEEIRLPERRRADTLAKTVPVIAAPTRTAKPETLKAEPNTIGKKYRITPAQERRVSDMAGDLNRYPALRDEVRRHKVRDSEVVRALIEWFAEQSVETQATLIRANRERERADQYGIGWPRPPRGGA